ncbi:endonuclease/exonuclease/phosphatase family protein [Aurantimonas sp. MSK8Z-1]|uniref:endonuclease/exonuclease/phosphatase family protein n=1 Tax=Mangrovibrevibacter kandeliae TaxID=2968473 RepID=UPI002117DDE1|nr:endonuclease/exonuclease/phosphatase family protein [Aurantimonas sp. MSK8Z-1]MCW4116356.1 endonuclease/exonuclease/phosphatase family protein [Aurantimonas sp. MSK8Z-1]
MLTILLLGLPTLVLALATGLSFVRIPHGIVRTLAFPRLQILVLAALLVPATFFLVIDNHWRQGLVLVQVLVVLVQAVLIAKFTPLWKRQSVRWDGDPAGDNTLSVFSFNVKMSNRRYDEALAVARDRDPDVAIFMETDAAWAEALEPLAETLPHGVREPLDNAYGLLVFSRLPIEEARIDYLVTDDVPSFSGILRLRDGQRFRLLVVHPEPPVPAMDTVGRDAELLLVADRAASESLPVVVTGDLNDVAWSHTTRLFQRVSGLLDPRVGRGFYNTFDARYPPMRWPLDHLFHDPRFKLIDMHRLPACGSDHFPMLFRLALTPEPAALDQPESDAGDRREADGIEAKGDRLERDAIGTDWEDA